MRISLKDNERILQDTLVIGRAGKVLRLVRVMRILRVFKVRSTRQDQSSSSSQLYFQLVRHFNGLQSLLSTLKQAYKGNLSLSATTEKHRSQILFIFFLLLRAGSADGAGLCLRPHILQVWRSPAILTTIILNLNPVDWEYFYQTYFHCLETIKRDLEKIEN